MRFSAEWWAFWAGVWAVGLTVGAAVAGLISWWASTIASTRSEGRTKTLELRVAGQQERAATAERALLELQEQLRPRTITLEQQAMLVEALKDAPKARVEIYAPIGDSEALMFARQIRMALSLAGWPLIGHDVELETRQELAGTSNSLILAVSLKRFKSGRWPPSDALFAALSVLGTTLRGGPMTNSRDDDTITLFVNPKPKLTK